MRSVTCGLLLVVPSLAHAAEPDTLAAKAQTVLKVNCARCHSQDGAAKGGFDYVLDRAKLIARTKVVIGEPDESELYQRVRDDKMPPSGVKQRPSAEERAMLKQWIAAGAPSTTPAASEAFLSEPAGARLIRDDLAALEAP